VADLPVPLLRDRRPIDLMRRGELDEVLGVLAGYYSGAFVRNSSITSVTLFRCISELKYNELLGDFLAYTVDRPKGVDSARIPWSLLSRS